MPTAEQLAAWKPRRIAGVVDVIHSAQLVDALTGEFLALGYDKPVADLAAASVVNMQMVEHFGLLDTEVRGGAQALSAIKVWAAQPVALRKAA